MMTLCSRPHSTELAGALASLHGARPRYLKLSPVSGLFHDSMSIPYWYYVMRRGVARRGWSRRGEETK